MGLKKPESMDECVYFTQRTIGSGEVMVWVLRETCRKCGKDFMSKPRDKRGKVLVREKNFVCPKCGYSLEKGEYENGLTASIEYTCPSCRFQGEVQVPFKRKNVEGVQTLRFQCQKCSANIDVTKKFKGVKKKSKPFDGDK